MSSQVENNQTAVAEETAPVPAAPPSPRRRVRRGVIGIVLVLVIAIGAGWYLYARGSEDTDDAQVDGHLIPIASRIDGTIQAVHVEDNQAIKAGDALIELDPRDYQVAVDQAKGAARSG